MYDENAPSVMSLRKTLAFICLIALLSAALSPAALSILPAIVVPLLVCCIAVVIAFAARQSETLAPQSFIYPSVVPSRAPPASL